MPQGPEHLHRRFGDDWTAWRYLQRRGFHQRGGVISRPHRQHQNTGAEWDAITYMVQEWDWAYDRRGGAEGPPDRSMLSSWGSWLRRASSGPLRVVDRYASDVRFWWYCVAKYELRRRWYYVTGRRKIWDDGADLTWTGSPPEGVDYL